MSNYIAFADGELIEIEEGAFLDKIVHVAKSEQDAISFLEKVTPENLNEVRFYGDDLESPAGLYTNLDLVSPTKFEHGDDGTFLVTISLCETTETCH